MYGFIITCDKMIPKYLVLTLFLLLKRFDISVATQLQIHPSLSQCELHGTALTCKFGGMDESVFLNDLYKSTNGKVTTVYIHNAKRLIVQKPSCADLSLYSVESAIFVDNRICDDKKKIISLRILDSEVNQVPRQLNRLEITRSTVGKVICDMGLQRLQMSESSIVEFSSPWPVGGHMTLKITNSNIDRFLAMNLESKTTLIIDNSTIGNIEREGLILGKDTTTYIANSVISSEENSILLKSGAKFTLRDTMGKIGITGAKGGEEETKRPPGVPARPTMITPDTEEEISAAEIDKQQMHEKVDSNFKPCKSGVSVWMWLCPTILATVEAFLLIVIWGQKVSKSQPIIPLKDDYEAAGGRTHNNSNYNMYQMNDSVQEFYSERQDPYLVKRR